MSAYAREALRWVGPQDWSPSWSAGYRLARRGLLVSLRWRWIQFLPNLWYHSDKRQYRHKSRHPVAL